MRSLLLSDRSDDKVYMSTAYFNPSHEYIDLITRHCHGEYHLLTASPQVSQLCKRAIFNQFLQTCIFAATNTVFLIWLH